MRLSKKANRISVNQFLTELKSGRNSGQSQGDRNSRIPLRSSSQSNRDKVATNQSRPRSNSVTSHTSRGTPLGHGRVTPSQFGIKITPSTSSTASSKKGTYYKDPRKLQDKEFIKEASQLVQSYFQEKFPEILINSTDIKPMTIKMFISMINHLFEVLGILDNGVETVQFTTSSYEKELPYWMKKLEYPGLITKAWLQTVNVPQYWPHVVGLLSWLAKLCSANAIFNMEDQLNTLSSRTDNWWSVYFFKKGIEAFKFHSDEKDEEYKNLCLEVVRKFQELHGATEDPQEIEKEIAELKEKLKDPALSLEKDAYEEEEGHLQNLQTEYLKLINDIEKKENNIENLKAKIIKKEGNCKLINEEIEETKKEIEELKTTISSQALSVEDIAEIEKKTGYLNKEIKCLEKECEDYSQLTNRYELEAAGMQDKILQSSHSFNRNIIQLEHNIPELKDFHIHIDLENENVVDYMEKMVKSFENLKNDYICKHQTLQEEYKESKSSLDEESKHLDELQRAIKSQEKINDEKRKENVKLQKNYDEAENNLKVEEKKWSEKVNSVENKLKELDSIKDQKMELELKCETLSRTLEEKKKFWSDFWITVEEKWSLIPNNLESFLDMINEQNKQLEEIIEKENNDLGL